MKITIYELLGLVKDGKAPKKIKYREMIYHICYEYGDYESDIEEYRFADIIEHYYLFESIDMLKCLNDEVEILEEEKKIPEKLKIEQDGQTYNNFYIVNQNGTKCYLTKHSKMIVETLNGVIDYLESKGDE